MFHDKEIGLFRILALFGFGTYDSVLKKFQMHKIVFLFITLWANPH